MRKTIYALLLALTVFLILAVTAGIAVGSCPVCWFI